MDAQEYFNRGNEFFDNDDFDRAIADYTEALRLKPDMAEAKNNLSNAYFNRGIASLQKGDNNRAIADITEAASLNPKNAQIYGARGWIKNQIGDFDGVINDYTEVIRLEPAATAYAQRAGAYHEKSKEALHAGDHNGFLKYKNLQIKDLEAALRFNPIDKELQEMVQKMLELAISERDLRKSGFEFIDSIKT